MEQQQDFDVDDVMEEAFRPAPAPRPKRARLPQRGVTAAAGGSSTAAVLHGHVDNMDALEFKHHIVGVEGADEDDDEQQQQTGERDEAEGLSGDESDNRIDQTIDEVINVVMEAHRAQTSASTSGQQQQQRRHRHANHHNAGEDDDNGSDTELEGEDDDEDDDELLDVGDPFMNCSAADMTALDGKLYGPDGRRKYKKITVEDQHLIRALRRDDGLGAVTIARILKGRVTVSAVKAFIRKLIATDQMHSRDAIKRKAGSGRPRRARTPDKIEKVRTMIENPQEMGTVRPGVTHISRQLGISRRAVYQIMKKDLKMKPTLVQPTEREMYALRPPPFDPVNSRQHAQRLQLQAQARAKRITRVVRPGAGVSGILSVVDTTDHQQMVSQYETADEQYWLEDGVLMQAVDEDAHEPNRGYTKVRRPNVHHWQQQQQHQRRAPVKVRYVDVETPAPTTDDVIVADTDPNGVTH